MMFNLRVSLRFMSLLGLATLGLTVGCAAPSPNVPPAAVPSLVRPTNVPTNLPPVSTPTSVSTIAPPAAIVASPTGAASSTIVSTAAPGLETDYPLALNDTWVYESTRYEGFNPQEIITATQIITETVVEVKSEASYFAAKIDRETSADTPVFVPRGLESLLRPPESSAYWLVVQGNRIYRQEGGPDLSNFGGTDSLEFVLPLKPGAVWNLFPPSLQSQPSGSGGIARQVSRTGTVQVPAGRFDGCLSMKDDWVDTKVLNWFCPGVGWVDLKSDHNGTPFGSRQVLIDFQLSNLAAGPRATPPAGEPTSAALTALDSFMQARISRDDQAVSNLLTDKLRSEITAGSIQVPFTQVSNPCWYRYLVLQFDQTSATHAQARVRVYQHFWGGDNAGGLPRSWEQEIVLVETNAGWRVDQLGAAENDRQEPEEPHGPTLSACTAWASTPASVEPAPTPSPSSHSSEFLTLSEAQKASTFSLLLPKFIPGSLPLYKAWVVDYRRLAVHRVTRSSG
jgi:hypothetical protein